MTALSIQPPFPTFSEADGSPLEDGYIWIGTANLNPITNPITVYWDAALTLPAAQPIRTQGGYPANNGTPARLYVNSDYSIQVQNRNGSVVYSAPAATERLSGVVIEVDSTDVSFLQAGTGAVTRTAQAKMRDVVSVKDFGAVGDGVTNDTAAIQTAIDANPSVYFPTGTYKITSAITLQNDSRLFGENHDANLVFEGTAVIIGTGLSNTSVDLLTLSVGSTHSGLYITRFNNCTNSQQTRVRFVGRSADKSKYMSIFGGDNNLIDAVYSTDASVFLTANNWDTVPTPSSDADWGKGNRVTRCTVTSPGQGIDCLWQQGVVLAFNRVIGATSTYGCGILLEAGNNDARVIGNVCTGNTRAGFYVEGAAAPNTVQRAQFIGNVGNSNGEAGITLSTNYKDIRIIGGSYCNNTGTYVASDALGSGIYMETAGNNVSILGATMIGNAYAGIVSFAQAFLLTRDNVVESSVYGHVALGGHSNCNFGRLLTAAISGARYNSVSYASSNRYDDAGLSQSGAVSTVNPITLGSGGAAATRWAVKTTGDVYVQLRIDLGTGFVIPPGSIQFTLAETGFTVPNRAMSTVVVIANGNYKLATTRVLPATSVVLAFESTPTWIAGDSITVELQWNVFDQ